MRAIRILFRNIRDAFKSVIRNFSLSVASITCTTITLILVAVAIILSYNVNSFTKDLESELSIVVYVSKDATAEEVTNIGSSIIALDNVLESNVVFKSKDDWKTEMQNYSEELNASLSYLTTNPLMDTYVVKIDDASKISSVAEQIKQIPKVDQAKYGEGTVDNLIGIFNIIEKVTIVIVIGLVVVTAFLISNTIKLAIYARRNEIEIMRLVGTSNLVIRLPFIFEGLILGIIGSIIPIIVTIYGYILAYDHLGGYVFSHIIKLVSPVPFVIYISLFVLVIGALVGMLGSYRAVRKFLKI